MTSQSGPSGPTPKEEKELMGGYFESYSKWVSDAETKRDKDLSRTQATFAVQGASLDDPIYQSAVNRITTGYEDEIASIEAGQTFQSLNDYYKNTLDMKYERDASAYEDQYGDALGTSERLDQIREREGTQIPDAPTRSTQTFEDFYRGFNTGGLSAQEEKQKAQDVAESSAQKAASGGADRRQRAQGTGATEASPWW